jgi:quercetin dioxygenase-like cupin family protein
LAHWTGHVEPNHEHAKINAITVGKGAAMQFRRGFSLVSFWILAVAVYLSRAQDPVKVAPQNYKVITENDTVRILDVNLPAGAKTASHSHPDLVGVVLEPGATKWTTSDGKSTQSPPDLKRGGVVYQSGSTHVTENTGKTALRAIVIEFKKPAPAAGKGRNPSLPSPYKQVDDNSRARSFQGTFSPGAKVPEHSHGDHVIVALSDATAEVIGKDGKKETLTFKKDAATFSGPMTHSAVNTGKTPLRLIVVEVK